MLDEEAQRLRAQDLALLRVAGWGGPQTALAVGLMVHARTPPGSTRCTQVVQHQRTGGDIGAGQLAVADAGTIEHAHELVDDLGDAVDCGDTERLRGMGARELIAHLGLSWWQVPLLARRMR